MKKLLNSELLIKSNVWNNESLELIDFSNYDYERTEIRVKTSGIISKIDKTITFTKGKNIAKTPFELFSIERDDINGFFYLNCGKPPKELIKVLESNCAYMVLKGNINNLDKINQKYYKLCQGDVIKLGRIYLKVLDINVEDDKEDCLNIFGTDINNVNDSKCSLFRCSSFRSAKINDQDIIFGFYSPTRGKRDHKTLEAFNSLNKNNNKVNIFAEQHKANFIKYNPLLKKKSKYLIRSNSAVEDFLFSSKNKNKKINNNKNEINKMIEKQKEKEQNLNSLISDNLEEKEMNNNNKKPRICRICYGKDTSIDNPLICPCICKGSMKYIHFKCLKNWLNSKIETDLSINPELEEEVGLTYCAKDLACELCKTKFPDYINHNGKIYNITFYKPKFKQYIILESIRSDRYKTKFIHILSFDNNKDQITLGRSNECELSIPELSVSRFHCFIHKEKNKLYIEDNNSKFGTCLLVQNPHISITDYGPFRLLKDKTYIKIKLIMDYGFFSCCNPKTFDSKLFAYEVQNHKYCDVASSFIIKVDNLEDDSENDDEELGQNENDKNGEELIGGENLIKKKKNKNKNIKKIKIKEQRDVSQGLVELSKVGNENSNNKSNNINIIPLDILNGMSTTKNNNLIQIKRNYEELNQNCPININENKTGLQSKRNYKENENDKLIDSFNDNKLNNNDDNKEKSEDSQSINLIDQNKD